MSGLVAHDKSLDEIGPREAERRNARVLALKTAAATLAGLAIMPLPRGKHRDGWAPVSASAARLERNRRRKQAKRAKVAAGQRRRGKR